MVTPSSSAAPQNPEVSSSAAVPSHGTQHRKVKFQGECSPSIEVLVKGSGGLPQAGSAVQQGGAAEQDGMDDREMESPKQSGREGQADTGSGSAIAECSEDSGDSGDSGSETDSSEDEDGRWTPEDSEARKAARKVRGAGGGTINQVEVTTM